MGRLVRSGLFLTFLLAVFGLFTVLTPSSTAAHDSEDCYGWSQLDAAWGLGYQYSTQSRCGTGWDTITATAVLVKIVNGAFVLDSLMEIDIDLTDDDAGVVGIIVLDETTCYISVGVHSAHEVHGTAFHVSNWLAFTFSPLRCTPEV